jgi:hypothetical protein
VASASKTVILSEMTAEYEPHSFLYFSPIGETGAKIGSPAKCPMRRLAILVRETF